MKNYRIAIIPGDGIGTEIMRPTMDAQAKIADVGKAFADCVSRISIR